MCFRNRFTFASLALTTSLFLVSSGCNQPTDNPETAQTNASAVDDHSGWWCAAHGIPEEVCSMCSAKAAADFKAKGDWCVEHNRAKSQCFKCDPALADKFAQLHVAKYGTKPPPIVE
jgi:hypothetical protein